MSGPISLTAQISAIDAVLAGGVAGLIRLGGHSRSGAELLQDRLVAAKQRLYEDWQAERTAEKVRAEVDPLKQEQLR